MTALTATALLPAHAGGGLGAWIAGLFLIAGLALALASIDLGWRALRAADGQRAGLRSRAALGAAGFAVGGAGLLADVLEQPIVAVEIVGVLAVAAWWIAAGRALREGPARGLGTFSLVLALLALVALGLHLAWDAPAGAVPARFAYALWGPWGVWLAAALLRNPDPIGER